MSVSTSFSLLSHDKNRQFLRKYYTCSFESDLNYPEEVIHDHANS